MNLKEQLESARNYALARIEKGEFKLIGAYFCEIVKSVRCTIEIDGYQINFVVALKSDFMFQSTSMLSSNIVLFNNAIEIPEKIKEIAKNL